MTDFPVIEMVSLYRRLLTRCEIWCALETDVPIFIDSVEDHVLITAQQRSTMVRGVRIDLGITITGLHSDATKSRCLGVCAALPRVSTEAQATSASQWKAITSHCATASSLSFFSCACYPHSHETSGERGPVASIEDATNLRRQYRRRQDHLLHCTVSSFPEEAAASAVCEAGVHWAFGRCG